MSTDSPISETQIFVSYSHHDAAYVAEDSLLGYLKGLQNDGARFWWDQSLQAGDVWDDQIKQHLLEADIALVLVSQWLLNSEYIRNVELQLLLQQFRRHGLIIFPVILSACDWRRYAWLAKLEHLPKGDKTLAEHYSGEGLRERIFHDIAEALRAKLKGEAPAQIAIEATSGAVNLINSLEPEYRSVVASIPEPHELHGLLFEGLGTKIRISRHGQLVSEITADHLRHLPAADLEKITTLQKAMRGYYDRWVSLYSRRQEPDVEQQLRLFARELAPDLKTVIEMLRWFGLDLEDHYDRFYTFVVSVGEEPSSTPKQAFWAGEQQREPGSR